MSAPQPCRRHPCPPGKAISPPQDAPLVAGPGALVPWVRADDVSRVRLMIAARLREPTPVRAG